MSVFTRTHGDIVGESEGTDLNRVQHTFHSAIIPVNGTNVPVST